MNKSIQKYLLAVARNSIAEKLDLPQKVVKVPVSDGLLSKKRGVFVTLEIDGKLRGCIGNIMPVYPLLEAVKNNAKSAAFEDPRFMPLTASEFPHVEIEISVLTVPRELEYDGANDLLAKITPGKDGVVIKKSFYEATYLPQVWDDLKDKEDFLSSLCVKAGIDAGEWRKGDLGVELYQVEMFKE